MAKSKKKSRSRGPMNGFKLPLALVAGAAVGPANVLARHRENAGNMADTARYANAIYTGYDPQAGFNFSNMKGGTIPLAVGALVHKIVGQGLGVNRALAQSRIPVIRV